MFDEPRFDQLRELLADDTAELHSIIEEYFDNTRQLQQTLRASLADGKSTEFCRAAHTLKSSSALLGAAGVSALCAELEALTRGGQLPPGLAARLDGLDALCEQATAWLRGKMSP